MASMTETSIKQTLEDFIVKNFLFGDAARKPSEETSLLETGILDSTGILELIEFVENEFDIQVKETETVPQNLDGIGRLVRYIQSKKGA